VLTFSCQTYVTDGFSSWQTPFPGSLQKRVRFKAEYFGTAVKTGFVWKQELTAVAPANNPLGNRNNVFMDDPNGLLRITQPATTSTSAVPLSVSSGLSSTNAVMTSAFRALRRKRNPRPAQPAVNGGVRRNHVHQT
jgi:hypothetical protein